MKLPRNHRRTRFDEAAFTLVELLVVVVILGTLSAVFALRGADACPEH